jgi:DNA-binding response OmpR family regulator/DNA-binding CsgD family transcriptional regulator
MKEYTILLADDYPEHLRILASYLKGDSDQYKIYLANDGHEAVEIAKKTLPQLIILDWDMPELDGLEATRLIRSEETTKDIPVILVSGMHTNPENLIEALNIGANDFLRKPVIRPELLARVKSVLRYTDSYKELIKLKELNFTQELNFKANELNFQALNLARQNEFLLFIREKIAALQKFTSSHGKQVIYNLIEEINKQIKEHSWENFEQKFADLNPGFMNLLGKKFPQLTPTERKLCCLIRMGLSSKEISAITFQESSSVDVGRYRLRQKLGLEKDVNLVSFLFDLF